MKKLILFVGGNLIFASIAYAELSNCNGVWTNGPCEGKASSVIEEKDFTPLDPQKQIENKKEQLLHDLRMKQLNSKRAYEVEVSIDAAEDVCGDPSKTVSDCRESIEPLSDKIDQLVLANKDLQAKKEKEAKDKEKVEEPAANTNYVTIIEERRGHRGRRVERGYHDGDPHHYREERSSTRSGINIGGTVSSERGGVGISIGGGSVEQSYTEDVQQR